MCTIFTEPPLWRMRRRLGTPCNGGSDVTPPTRNPSDFFDDLYTVTLLRSSPGPRRPARSSPEATTGPRPLGWRRVIVVAAATIVLAACGGDEELNLSPAAAEGRSIAQDAGCASCHGADGGGQVGPAWKGLAGSVVSLADGTTITADTDYLTRSITDPDADLVEGYTIRMPGNTLTEAEVASVVAYIEELR